MEQRARARRSRGTGRNAVTRRLVDAAVEAGADAVKFQKRKLSETYRREILDQPRHGEQGLQYLVPLLIEFELSDDQFRELFEYCVDEEIPYIYASSAAVYGAGPGFREDRACEAPLNVYGYSKFLFDQYVRRNWAERSAQEGLATRDAKRGEAQLLGLLGDCDHLLSSELATFATR